MRRAALLELAGITVDQWRALSRPDPETQSINLPFFKTDKYVRSEGWTEFDASDVVALAWTIALAEAGIAQRGAASIVGSLHERRLKELWPIIIDIRMPDTFLGVVQYERDVTKNLRIEHGGTFIGPLARLQESKIESSEGKAIAFSEIDRRILNIRLCNLSKSVRQINERARMAGIDIDLAGLFDRRGKAP